MKRLIRLGALSLAALLLVAACRHYLPTNRYLRLRNDSRASTSTADARGKFDHAKHRSPLAESDVGCLDCHRFDLVIDTGEEELAREISRRGQMPGSEACHFCHGPETAVSEAPKRCTTCHQNLAPLKPEDHEVGWLRVHAGAARSSPQRCENCHAQSFCIDCHQARDTIRTRVHERNFLFFHSVEARANPMKCGSCHRLDFCSTCHERAKVNVNER